MTKPEKFKDFFTEEYLKEVFVEQISFSRATGIDNLSPDNFRKHLDDQVSIISRKVLAGQYKFTKFKLKLISKGRNKYPREISIPTVRDRIVLRALCDFLMHKFEKSVKFDLPQNVIKSIKRTINLDALDGVIKLDVANFYPSIEHNKLTLRIAEEVTDPNIHDLISKAIKTPTVSISTQSDKPNTIGVPQGLSVSNVLAAIYLSNIDKLMAKELNIKYHRYVDDILILCDHSLSTKISKELIKKFKSLNLEIHDPIEAPLKSSIGLISSGFDYLGYKFGNGNVRPKLASIDRFKNSLVSIFTSYKYSRNKSELFLLWRINLRITGCIYENKSKGWLFFFAEITDETLLHQIDAYIQKLIKRFNVSIKPKRLVRAYKELSHNKYETNYIPNFDDYTIEQKKRVLTEFFGFDEKKLIADTEIDHEFKKKLSKQVRDLEVDIMNFS